MLWGRSEEAVVAGGGATLDLQWYFGVWDWRRLHHPFLGYRPWGSLATRWHCVSLVDRVNPGMES